MPARALASPALACAALLITVLSAAVIAPCPAAASCAAGPPIDSPHVFTGVVVATTAQGRIARVRTSIGTVEVHGIPAGSANAASSVDRFYRTGGRYEFHPINATAPFEDNACTATHLLSFANAPGAAHSADTSGPVAAGLLTFLAVVTSAVLVWQRRRRDGAAG